MKILLLLMIYLFFDCNGFQFDRQAFAVRASSAPYISGDSFRAIAHHIHDDTTTLNPFLVNHKDIIFVKTDKLEDFFANVHAYIQHRYILVTHNADNGSPGQFVEYLNDDKIIAWLGQSPSIMNHPKFIPIPLGIANRYWKHGSVETFDKILRTARPSRERKYLLGVNFRTNTNPGARENVLFRFLAEPFCGNLFCPDHEQYLRNMMDAKFIISPEGNSLDCHRIWEALYMGSIPIVRTSALDPMLADLPVLIVQDWNEITEPFLTEKYAEIKARRHTFNYGKLFFTYWLNLIEQYRDAAE